MRRKVQFDDSSWSNAVIPSSDGEGDFPKAVFAPQLQQIKKIVKSFILWRS